MNAESGMTNDERRMFSVPRSSFIAHHSPLHPLQRKLVLMRRRLYGLRGVYGLSWVTAAGMSGMIGLGLIDYLVRFEDRGLRVMASGALLAVLGWAVFRGLVRPWLVRPGDVDLARRLDRCFPVFSDRLASAVDFLHGREDDPTAGSPSLRRAVVAETTALAEAIDFRRALPADGALKALGLASAAGLIATALAVLDPVACRTAMVRLAAPLGNDAWPQVNHLGVRPDVHRVARGQSFEVEIIDRMGARLPRDVQVWYQFPAAGGAVEVESLRPAAGRAVARRENVARTFRYRVQGGDDRSMPWNLVEVVDPPAVESLAVRLFPPSYTGRPAETAQRHFRAFSGTRVEISGRATKPLRSAVLSWVDGRRASVGLSADGLALRVPPSPALGFSAATADSAPPAPRPPSPAPPPAAAELTVRTSGSYVLKLVDRQGLTGEVRGQVQAVVDAVPSVAIERPPGDLLVTATADVPLRIVAKDDLALRELALAVARSDRPGASAAVIPLYAGPPRAIESPPPPPGGERRGDQRVIDHLWRLAGLALSPGVQVQYHATATDYLSQTGSSAPRRLIVVGAEELADSLNARLAAILAELEGLLAIQRQSRSQVSALEVPCREGRVGQIEVDRLRGAEMSQRQVSQTLTSRTDGLPARAAAILEDLDRNKLDSPGTARELQGLLVQIDQVAKEHLAAVGQELSSAVKAAQIRLDEAQAVAPPGAPSGAAAGRGHAAGGSPPTTAAADPRLSAALVAVGHRQDQVIVALQRMVARLGQWDGFRRVRREVDRCVRREEELVRRTETLSRQTLAKELGDLTDQESAALAGTAEDQRQLAVRWDSLQQDIEQAQGQLRQSNPSAGKTLAEAVDRARQLAISARMRSAADRLQANRIANALDEQQQSAEDLQEILDVLARRRGAEPGRDKPPGEAEGLGEKLRQVRARQQRILDQTLQWHRLERSQGRLTRGQAAAVLETAAAQASLSAQTGDAAAGLSADALGTALSRIAAEMDQAAHLLQDRAVGAGTQDAQRNALRRLDSLLARGGGARSGSEAGQAHSGTQAGADATANRLASRRADARSAEPEKPPAAASGTQSGTPGAGTAPSRPAAEGKPHAPRPDPSLAAQVRLQRWGELPEHARQQMLQLPADEFLPQYEDLIEQYFRRLAEEPP
jgi:hypothetical protein